MLHDADTMITFSSNDLVKAKAFYNGVLGLDVDDSMPGMLQVKLAGGKSVNIYEKEDHQPATYTLINFTVDSLAATMATMRDKGVVFETYDLPNCKTDENGVVDYYGAMKIAFFNDPAGNNHAVLEMTK